MPLTQTTTDSVRLETLLALALSQRWTAEVAVEAGEQLDSLTGEANQPVASEENELPEPLQTLGTTDRRRCSQMLRRYAALTKQEQDHWINQRLTRIRANTPERNRRLVEDIHPGQIAEALRVEPSAIQLLILNSLPPTLGEVVKKILPPNWSGANGPELVPELAQAIRSAFFAKFVATEALEKTTPLDHLSVVELARLIRLLGVRETAIACRGISAVETVTAFLKRFSAEDAYAIVSHLAVLKTVDDQRVSFAEQLARMALGTTFDQGSAMLDRAGLALLGIALRDHDVLRKRHTAQKLPVAAARELESLLASDRTVCERSLKRQIVEEAESLAAYLHASRLLVDGDRRGEPALSKTKD